MPKIKKVLLAVVIMLFSILFYLYITGYGSKISSGLRSFSSVNPNYTVFPLGQNSKITINLENKQKGLDYLLVFKAEFLQEKLFKDGKEKNFDQETDKRQRTFMGLIPEDNSYPYSFELNADDSK